MPVTFGVIFDWDGVIIDSSRQHEESWEALARERGLSLPPGHFLKGFGKRNSEIIPDLLNWSQSLIEIESLSNRKEELYRDILRERGLKALPGVNAFLAMLGSQGVPCVIGSSTPRENIETALEITGIINNFKGIVAAADVSQGKPHPEVFLKAASKIEFPPSRCVVIEDAQVGIEAALAGGFKVVAVTNTCSRSQLTRAHKIVDNLGEVKIETLRLLFS